ncbi:hypothetical protein AURDEDRAFT_185001 [Auricularia subglabra TFB-10046 SS5]|uniref:C2H2-type domain-containing protein n=1 Tax=Auricularia subglabra (strain TFB-10046 / SS5) TaxID=717982 RepID=J0LKL9_AURST|nr:hypothetical protein AURDEDRAFT_185001 [Auricularia subglabra TFB-10046 SS5]
MSAPLCLWNDCPSPGPYASHKALFEHLKAEHDTTLGDSSVFACQWAECTHVSTSRQTRAQHLGRHTAYRPYICAQADCGKAYTCQQDLSMHRTRHTTAPPESECRCEWAGCVGADAVFPGAAELREHIEQAHARRLKRGLRCGWEGCVHVFAGGNFKAHVWAHLPAWYKPFACPSCDRTFSTGGGLARHTGSKHSTDKPSAAGGNDSGDDASDYAPARATAAKTAWGVSRRLSDARSSRKVSQESLSDDDTSESAPAPKKSAYAAARSMASADSMPSFSLGASSDDDNDDGSDYAPTPAAKKCAPASAAATARGRPSGVYRAAAKRAREPASDDSASDDVPLSARNHAPPSASKPGPAPSWSPPQLKSPAPPPPPPDSPATPTPSHRPKLTLNLKRPRLDPPRAADASESELDIVITRPCAPKPTHASAPQPRVPNGSGDEIAKAVAEIIDSPVWARAAQISAARVAARKEKERERQGARGEDGDDWEYCT